MGHFNGKISNAHFYDDRLRGLGVACGRISHFPIDLHRRPYSTLARQVPVCDITVRILIVDHGRITNIFVKLFFHFVSK